MASGQWQIFSFPAVNTAASADVYWGTTGGQVIRLRSLQARLSGSGAGAATLVVRDGQTGAGTIIWETSMNNPAGGADGIVLSDMDLRAYSGEMTIETTGAGGANTQLSVNAQGDLVLTGYSAFAV